MQPSRDIARLIEIMAALRTPGTGCPWDLAQSFATIAPYTIEEAYEVADAIQRGDMDDLEDELGDLLLQVVYHARLAEEQDAFRFGDVVEAITGKMIRRHPHVFGDSAGSTTDPASVRATWEEIKAAEKQASGAEPESVLDGVPVSLPALTRAVKLQDKAARVGFDWPSLAPVFTKLEEEIAELAEVALPADPRGATESDAATRGKVVEEYGDLLFVMANVARHLKIDPEAALRDANAKFVRRFGHVERRLAEQGSAPERSTLAEMDALWDEAKSLERGGS